jgi:dipeptidase E
MNQSTSRLLLISNSTLFGSGYLDHAEMEICDFLRGVKNVLFIPFALKDWEVYTQKVRQRFESMGYTLSSVHESANARSAIENAEAVFIGGGNTFRLLAALYAGDVLGSIRRRVEGGMPYLGASAGSNVACPTIRTTNDMPIVEPPSFKALGLVNFQINPHFLDPDPNSRHMGETREERIIQFLEENETPVVGLREGALVRVEHGKVQLKGSSGARLFRRGHDPVEVNPVADLEGILS